MRIKSRIALLNSPMERRYSGRIIVFRVRKGQNFTRIWRAQKPMWSSEKGSEKRSTPILLFTKMIRPPVQVWQDICVSGRLQISMWRAWQPIFVSDGRSLTGLKEVLKCKIGRASCREGGEGWMVVGA